MSKPRKISNSQIMSIQKCPKRFYWGDVLRLKPKTYPTPLEKGISGHRMMEFALLAMQQGADYEEAIKAITPFLEGVADDPEKLSVYRHVTAFMARIYQEEWKPVHVEVNFGHVIKAGGFRGADVEFVFTPDFVYEYTKGVKRGQLGMFDFKFLGQYWNQREIDMYQQVPKYIRYLKKATGEVIRNGNVVMLNTRAANGATGDSLYRIQPLDLAKEKLDTIERENLRLMYEIDKWLTLHGTDGKAYPRTVDTHQCKMCFFADNLCPMDLKGRDVSRVIERSFELNTYFSENYEQNEIDGG